MKQAYLSGPIIHDELRMDDFYKLVVDLLEKRKVSIFAPQFLPPATSDVIYSRDVEHVRKCDFLIAEVSNPSLGVGMEIMLAIELIKPVLLFRHTQSKPLSKMVLGATGTVLFDYCSMDEVKKTLQSINLDGLVIKECPTCSSYVSEKDENGTRCVACKTVHS